MSTGAQNGGACGCAARRARQAAARQSRQLALALSRACEQQKKQV